MILFDKEAKQLAKQIVQSIPCPFNQTEIEVLSLLSQKGSLQVNTLAKRLAKSEHQIGNVLKGLSQNGIVNYERVKQDAAEWYLTVEINTIPGLSLDNGQPRRFPHRPLTISEPNDNRLYWLLRALAKGKSVVQWRQTGLAAMLCMSRETIRISLKRLAKLKLVTHEESTYTILDSAIGGLPPIDKLMVADTTKKRKSHHWVTTINVQGLKTSPHDLRDTVERLCLRRDELTPTLAQDWVDLVASVPPGVRTKIINVPFGDSSDPEERRQRFLKNAKAEVAKILAV
jgi:Mn-dependent DtxR family transcriptional regulator